MTHRTALLAATGLGAALLLSGCGGSSLPPEAVVRAWNDSVVTRADDRAAKLFAPGAIVVGAGGAEQVLRTPEDAIAWSRALPCDGLVRKIQTHQDIVTVTFLLGNREAGSCAAAGGTMTAEFEIRHKRIVFFRELSRTAAPPPAPTPAPSGG